MRGAFVGLTKDEEAEFYKERRYYWDVTTDGRVLVREPRIGITGTGRTIGQALDHLKARS